jgi:hypothetical protein
MSKIKLLGLTLVVAALAATGAGWKWAQAKHGSTYHSYRVAGWTWDGSAARRGK